MSILLTSANTGLDSTTNLSNPQSCTKLVWAKLAAPPANFQTFLGTYNGPHTSFNSIFADNAGHLQIGTSPGTSANFTSAPTWGNWNCYAITNATAGANSFKGYWQDNAGGGFVSQSINGISFTVTNDDIANLYLNQSMTMAFYMEWSVPLSLSDLNTQFLSNAPIVQLGSLRRYNILSNSATAGNDTSGNGYNMTVNGSISDGAGLPTFPSNNQQPLLLLGA